MNRDSLSSLVPWHGETVVVRSSTETTIAISEIEVGAYWSYIEREREREREREYSPLLQVEGLKMVVSNSINLASCRNSFLSAMGQGVLISKEQTSSHDNVAEMISDLKVKCIICTICVHVHSALCVCVLVGLTTLYRIHFSAAGCL